FLILTAIRNQVGGTDLGVCSEAERRSICTGNFFDQHGGMAKVAPRSTVFFGYRGTQQRLCTGLAPDLPGHDAVLFPLIMERYHVFINETANLIPEDIVVLAKDAAHGVLLQGSPCYLARSRNAASASWCSSV